MLVYFPSGECVDEVVNNRTNYQFTSVIVAHSMDSTKVCWIIRRTVFIVYVCLSNSWRYKHYQFERHNEKPKHQRQFFENLDNIYI